MDRNTYKCTIISLVLKLLTLQLTGYVINDLIAELYNTSLGTYPLCIERKGSGIACIIELSPFPRSLGETACVLCIHSGLVIPLPLLCKGDGYRD